ncbi:hypothetical protein PLICRDRAFT_28321 [Plicaturopsis crispa FD-325 SS-3]|nr:hypothetical protein PLICRDRAFT_28321 [Plicaturopsis crispa FD-325 SS-3]
MTGDLLDPVDLSQPPIARLPNEMLIEIFAYGDPTYTKDALPSHFVASHVSQHWRHVVLDTPMLWTYIACVLQPLDCYPLALLDAHLERSRMQKLHIHCDSDSDTFFQRIVPHIHRWASYVFRNGHHLCCISGLLQLLVDLHAPNLRRLEIAGATTVIPSYLLKGGAPLLSSFACTCRILQNCTIPGITNTLTELTLGAHGPAWVLDVLEGMQSLESLSIDTVQSWFGYERVPLIALPKLTTLSIKTAARERPYSLVKVFSSIATPALESLHLQFASRVHIHHLETWLTSESQSSLPHFPRLRELFLRDTEATPELMRMFPNITHAEVCDLYARYDDTCCGLLLHCVKGVARNVTPLWPRLRSLCLELYNHKTTCDPSEIVAARIAAGCPLDSLVLRSNDRQFLPSEDVARWLEQRVGFEMFCVK